MGPSPNRAMKRGKGWFPKENNGLDKNMGAAATISTEITHLPILPTNSARHILGVWLTKPGAGDTRINRTQPSSN